MLVMGLSAAQLQLVTPGSKRDITGNVTFSASAGPTASETALLLLPVSIPSSSKTLYWTFPGLLKCELRMPNWLVFIILKHI
jgi:hypothetical protein